LIRPIFKRRNAALLSETGTRFHWELAARLIWINKSGMKQRNKNGSRGG
jgi:hypothetical protein